MAYYDDSTGWVTTKLHTDLKYNENLFSQEEHTQNIKKLIKSEENIDVQLNQYQSPDIYSLLESLKKSCQPCKLLGPIGGHLSIDIVDKEKKIFEVGANIRAAKFEDELDLDYEGYEYMHEKLTSSALCQKEETKHIVLEILGCYESVIASYFKIFGLSSRQKIDEAQIYKREKEGDGGAKWEAYCKTYFASLERRKTYFSNLIAAIHPSKKEVGLDSSSTSSTSKSGFVYFIRNRDLYKIGITENLLRRFGELNPDEVLNVVRCSNFKQLERELQSKFKSVRLPQTEYFRLNAEMIEQANRIMAEKSTY